MARLRASRWNWPRLGTASALLLVASALAVGPAAAATARYASPSGSGTACTAANPCALQTAISGAAAGDDVNVLARRGDYHFNADLVTDISVPIHIHGVNGRPRLLFASGELKVIAATAQNLYVQGNSGKTAVAFEDGAIADRIVVTGGSGQHACYIRGSKLTNSICAAASSGDIAIESDSSNIFRNDTFVGGTEAALKAFGRSSDCSCSAAKDTLVNVIARSAAGGVDLDANSDGTATMNIAARYSNYGTTSKTGAGAPTMTTITVDATDQHASPTFVNRTAHDLHQTPGSPTINAGLNSSANGSRDVDANARILGARTDIGADEFVPPPGTKITKSTIRPGRHKASFAFAAIGRASGFQCTLQRVNPRRPQPAFSSCSSPKTYRQLKAGTYRFKVRARSSSGVDRTPAKKRFTI
ncbi:MAG: hypothetical protein QOJ03_1388 [Frankiaceae bacterium]|jgi:hypothetical protein|nr:hypothetical protein [Frankiaceae bacterium]